MTHPQEEAHHGGESADAGWALETSEAARSYPVRTEADLLTVRHAVRDATEELGFSLVDQTRVVTAASELVRNAYVHGGGGTLFIDPLRQARGVGIRLVVTDEGPGIEDARQAIVDGFTTGSGLGHGLGGARRLMHTFEVHSVPGKGTMVTAVRWTDR
ncbi:ATP-binding protein [Streptomyces sp. NPDC054784]